MYEYDEYYNNNIFYFSEYTIHMIKNFIHAVIYTLFGLTSIFSTFAIVVEVPPSQGQKDVIVTGPTVVQADEWTLFELIQKINSYLRFAIWVVCMALLIIWWIQLITANGNDAKMKQANKLLMWALIGILISIFSYAIIRIIVNLL